MLCAVSLFLDLYPNACIVGKYSLQQGISNAFCHKNIRPNYFNYSKDIKHLGTKLFKKKLGSFKVKDISKDLKVLNICSLIYRD